MNFSKKIIVGAVTAGILISTVPMTFALDEPILISAPVENSKLCEVGDISICEFVRAAVIAVEGEQPTAMDTHYAMSYMRKAQELGWISEIPMDTWDETASRDAMNQVLGKLDAEKRQKVLGEVNSLLVENIVITGKQLELGGLETFVRNGNVMIPLRKTAETLGFTVTWNAKSYTAHIDNQKCKTDLQIGFDSYFLASSQAIGLTQAVPLGTPPMLVEGNTYVPAKVFSMLFCNPSSVSVKDGTLYIDENAENPQKETLVAESPDKKYRAEAYGIDPDITASGLYPYEGMRVIRNSDNTEIWKMTPGYFVVDFSWSPDSRYVSVYGQARTFGESFIVDTQSENKLQLPGIKELAKHYSEDQQPQKTRPDPYIKVNKWTDNSTILIDFQWTTEKPDEIVSGQCTYNLSNQKLTIVEK